MSRYIDADKLLKEAEKDGAYGYVSAYEIAHFPTADVAEVKRGRWKPFDLTWGRSVYACTACGDAMEVPTEMGKPMYNYCPWCGAKMENEK